MKGKGRHRLHSYDPAECEQLASRTDEAIEKAMKDCPALAESKFVGPMLKLLVYSQLHTSDENKIALSASATKELIDAVLPEANLPNLERLVPHPSARVGGDS